MSQLAQALIAKEKEERTGYLDLGNCGLTELPEELFDCVWLEILVVNSELYDIKQNYWAYKENRIYPSNLIYILSRINSLKCLKNLIIQGESIGEWGDDELNYLARISSLKSLDISNSEITDIKFLKNFQYLEILDLSYTMITDYKVIENLVKLKSLTINENSIKNVSFLEKLIHLEVLDITETELGSIIDIRNFVNLKKLKRLNLSAAEIKNIDFLSNLKSLEALNIGGNHVKSITFLEHLLNLKILDISWSKISNFNNLKKLTRLTHLDISGNEISDFRFLKNLTELMKLNFNRDLFYRGQVSDFSFLKDLKQLQSLSLNNNQISDLSFLKDLQQLQTLDLSNNQINDLSFLKDLKQLESLSLSNNQISDLSFLKDLKQLESLDLRSNQIGDISLAFLENLKPLSRLYLEGNPLKKIPKAIYDIGFLDDCLTNLKNYLQAKAKGEIPNQEAKILLIGNGRVGKTCIVHRWLDDSFNLNQKSTHSIQIREWSIDGLQLYLWDFGGQDIYHATHQLFMRTRATYVLAWDWKTEFVEPKHCDDEGNEFDNHPLAYWLDYWQTLSSNSPILIVRNKIDDAKYEFKVLPFKKEYAQQYALKRTDFRQVSAKTGEGFEDLKKRLIAKVKGMSELQELIPTMWETVRQEIRALQAKKQKTLDYQHYQKLCDAAGLSLISETSHQTLMTFLHHTGVVFYQKSLFDNQIILDQAWAIEAIYTLFDREGDYYELLENKKGKFNKAFLYRRWKKRNQEGRYLAKYSKKEQDLFISFMKSCEMIFEVYKEEDGEEVHDYYIAPQLLPKTPDSSLRRFWKKGQSDQYFKYQYKFLHQGILSRFLVRVGQQAEETAMWRNGVWLTMDDSDILVQVQEAQQDNSIIIRAKGRQAAQLLDLVKNTFQDIHAAFQPQEWVSLNGADWVALQALRVHPTDMSHIQSDTGKWLDYAPFQVFLQWATERSLQEVDLSKKTRAGQGNNRIVAQQQAIKNFISFGELGSAMSRFLAVTEQYGQEALHRDLMMLSGRYHQNEGDADKGILTTKEYRLEKARISAALVRYLGKLC